MKVRTEYLLVGIAVVASVAPTALGHFRLLEPDSRLEESQLGDPQKAAPCGGTSTDPGKLTGRITSVVGGEKLHLRIQETVFHPGFYRVALAVNSTDELPKDPEAQTEPSPNGPKSVSGAIHFPVVPPVLADGLFQHASKFDKVQEADIDIPNITCSKCVLQIVEFMAAHGLNKDGDYSYHHCAVVQIRANPNKPVDTRFPAGGR